MSDSPQIPTIPQECTRCCETAWDGRLCCCCSESLKIQVQSGMKQLRLEKLRSVTLKKRLSKNKSVEVLRTSNLKDQVVKLKSKVDKLKSKVESKSILLENSRSSKDRATQNLKALRSSKHQQIKKLKKEVSDLKRNKSRSKKSGLKKFEKNSDNVTRSESELEKQVSELQKPVSEFAATSPPLIKIKSEPKSEPRTSEPRSPDQLYASIEPVGVVHQPFFSFSSPTVQSLCVSAPSSEIAGGSANQCWDSETNAR